VGCSTFTSAAPSLSRFAAAVTPVRHHVRPCLEMVVRVAAGSRSIIGAVPCPRTCAFSSTPASPKPHLKGVPPSPSTCTSSWTPCNTEPVTPRCNTLSNISLYCIILISSALTCSEIFFVSGYMRVFILSLYRLIFRTPAYCK
jgi:hypothetical protein